jgi:type II secretory pathway component PulF
MLLEKLSKLESTILSIVRETNTSLERSNEKIMDLALKSGGDDSFTSEIVERYIDDVISQRQTLLRSGLTLLDSIEVAKSSNLTDKELKTFIISMNAEIERIAG